MKDFFKGFLSVVFSGFTLLILVAVGFGYFLVTLADRQHKEESFCYAQNMVRVNTDAGPRCVLPNSLLEIK
jgi:hypothetical protein